MKFFSLKYTELIVTVDPKTFVVDAGFRVTKGMMGLFPQGLSIQFKNKEFDTKSLRMSDQDERKLINILKRHPSYGVSFIASGEELDQEAAANRDAAEAERKAVAAKVANTDKKTPVKPAQS